MSGAVNVGQIRPIRDLEIQRELSLRVSAVYSEQAVKQTRAGFSRDLSNPTVSQGNVIWAARLIT